MSACVAVINVKSLADFDKLEEGQYVHVDGSTFTPFTKDASGIKGKDGNVFAFTNGTYFVVGNDNMSAKAMAEKLNEAFAAANVVPDAAVVTAHAAEEAAQETVTGQKEAAAAPGEKEAEGAAPGEKEAEGAANDQAADAAKTENMEGGKSSKKSRKSAKKQRKLAKKQRKSAKKQRKSRSSRRSKK